MKPPVDLSLGHIDRRKASTAVLAAALVLAVLLGFWTAGSKLHALESRVEARKADLERFTALGAEYRLSKARVEAVSRRAYAAPGPGGGAITAMEEIAKTVGAGISAVKPLGRRTTRGYTEKDLEVKLDRVDLNQVINLLYLTENSRTLLVIKEFSMKSRFDDPELLDITLKLTEVTKSPIS